MATENTEKNELNGKSKSGSFILKHKMVFTLLLIIVIISLWAFIKISIVENHYKKDILKMKSVFENKMDSLTAKQLILTSKAFSWAIRSELTRENKEQVNQFFMSFIKEPGVNRVEFVNASDSKVSLSTNKKDEGTTFTDQVAIMTTKAINYRNDSILTIVSPVMGLNNKLGVLVIEYNLRH
jgi:L-lactate utilization protein LutC